MSELASRGQLRMGLFRWVMVTVPLMLLLGFGAARLTPSGGESRWYQALVKPDVTPPGWLFPIAWTTLYILLGIAIALILHARGARLRGLAIGLFVASLVPTFLWTPIFFGMHQVMAAFWTIVLMLVLAIATTLVFGRIRRQAAWLMVPYLVWISFAGVLTYSIDRLNPDAATLVPPPATTKILL